MPRCSPKQDLNAIAAFYSSDAGKKLLSDGPIVTRELVKAADIWQRGIARDLAQSVGTKLATVVKSQARRSGSAGARRRGAAPRRGAPTRQRLPSPAVAPAQ